MKNSIKNSKAFTSLTFVTVLMSFMTLYFTAAFAIAISQQRDYVRTVCVQEATENQSQALTTVRYLFQLNMASSALRWGIKINKIAILAATVALQFHLIPPMERILKALKYAQQGLDKIQKAIILKAKVELQIRHYAMIIKINRGLLDKGSNWNKMLTMMGLFVPTQFPELAIRPDSKGGIAPNYEWQDEAEQKQTLAYSWNMFFKTRDDYQTMVKWMNIFSLQCSVAPNLKEDEWKLTINADK